MARSMRFAAALLLVLMAAAGWGGQATADDGPFTEVVHTPFGTFGGIDYVLYEGQFIGEAPGGSYSMLFQVIAPADPSLSNGILVLEPFHMGNLAAARDVLYTPDFLFTQRFMYAGLNWYLDGNPFNAMVDLSEEFVADAAKIISDFVAAMQSHAQGGQMVGTVQRIYATGLSRTSQVIHAVLHTAEGQGLFDLAMLNAPRWYKETHDDLVGIGKVMVILSESELVADALFGQRTALLRGSSPTYRSYEVAGAAHIPDTPGTRALYGPLVAESNPLDWYPVTRALFVAGHYWVMEGTEPPPSVTLAEAPENEIDAVYGVVTGIARDALRNALGGVRLPDLAIDRGQYIAVNPGSFWEMGLAGSFVDMKCQLQPDGTHRFPTHESYVSQFTQAAEALEAAGFLLEEDTSRLVAEASQSAPCPRMYLPFILRPDSSFAESARSGRYPR